MDGWLKQSTAITKRIGPFLDETDGKTAETALTISQADVRLSKAGGAFAQKNDATSCTHDENGYYSCPLNATDTGTLGMLKLAVHESGALPVWHTYMVVPANIWDSLFGADKLQVHADEITAGLITAAAIADNAIAAAKIATGAITNAKFAAGAIDAAAIANAAIDIATFAADCKTGSLLNAHVKGQDNIDFGALQKASINAEVDAALADIDLDHLIQITAGAEEPTDGSYLDQIMHKDVSQTFDPTTDSLEAIRDTTPLGTAMRGTDNAALASVCTEGRLSELDAANIPADIDTLLTRLSAARAGYLDNLSAGAVALASVCTEGRLSELDAANLPADIDTLLSRVTAAVALASVCTEARLAELDSGNLPQTTDRIFWLLNNKMNVTDATGAAALRNIGDSADIATGSITDDDTTTVRAEWSWS